MSTTFRAVTSDTVETPAFNSRAVLVRSPRLALPASIERHRVNWAYAITIFAIHLLALFALVPHFFNWTSLIVMVAGVHLFGQSINLCYHRQLTHRSFHTPKWLEHLLVWVALCCLQDTPGRWVATHRKHHLESDQQPDPHSPLVSFVWAHIGWLLVPDRDAQSIGYYTRYARDVLQDPFYMWLEKNPVVIFIAYSLHAALFFMIGFGIGFFTAPAHATAAGLQFAMGMLVWGVFVRTVVVWHITWSVNSLTHLFGYRSYETPEHSTNNWFVALLAGGEGWHNNHHHDQACASNQRRWWELDVTYYEIQLLRWFGLARGVMPAKMARLAAAVTRTEARAAPPEGSASQVMSPDSKLRVAPPSVKEA